MLSIHHFAWLQDHTKSDRSLAAIGTKKLKGLRTNSHKSVKQKRIKSRVSPTETIWLAVFIKEKTLGALAAGITRVFIPRQNSRSIEEIPEETREMMQFELIERVQDVVTTFIPGLKEVD